MTRKGWLIGCGSLVLAGAGLVVLAVGFFAIRATNFTRSIDEARDRYAGVNRDFPFSAPPNGELSSDRFERYLKVRAALNSAMAPLSESNGPIEALTALTRVPDEVSRAHVDALSQNSMSLDEYRWISRQIYTTVAAEEYRKDPDPDVLNLRRPLQSGQRRRGGITVQNDPASHNAVNLGLLDFTWLRVPDATRVLIRQHAAELAKTGNAATADTFLFQVDFERSRQ